MAPKALDFIGDLNFVEVTFTEFHRNFWNIVGYLRKNAPHNHRKIRLQLP